MSAAETSPPATTATPLFFSVPVAGSVVILTAARLFAGVSLGSVEPKSAAPKVSSVSSFVVPEPVVPTGSSFTEVTLIVTVAGALSVALVSVTLNVKESLPLKLAFSVYVTLAEQLLGLPTQVTVPIEPRVPFDGPETIANVSASPSGSEPVSVIDLAVSSDVETVWLFAVGAPLPTLIETVAAELFTVPSFTRNVKLSEPV